MIYLAHGELQRIWHFCMQWLVPGSLLTRESLGTRLNAVPYLNGRDIEQVLPTLTMPVEGQCFVHLSMTEFAVHPVMKGRGNTIN